MNTQHGHVGRYQGLTHERRQNSGIIANMTFSLRNGVATHDCDDTLQYVVLAPGVLS
jgi:hypothetical protein